MSRWTERTAIFLMFAAVSSWLLSVPAFPDGDGFYHARLGELLLQGKVVTEFPWLPFTTLAEHYADFHFLFHAMLAPWIGLTDPMVGTVIGSVLLAGLAGASFTYLLQCCGVRHAWVFGVVLLSSPGFVARIAQPRAIGLSVALLFFGQALMVLDRRRWLFVIAFAYVWAYGAWPVLPVSALCALAARLLAEHLEHPQVSALALFRRLSGCRELAQLACATGGALAGLVLNPFFPDNLQVYWVQIVKIALVGQGGTIPVGNEWGRISFPELVNRGWSIALLLSVLVAAALVGGLQPRSTPGSRNDGAGQQRLLWLVGMAIAFFFLTLKSRRNIEYFAPFAVAALALASQNVGIIVRGRDWAFTNRRWITLSLLSPLICACWLVAWRQLRSQREDLRTDHRFPWTSRTQVAEWLKANTPQGSVLVHAGWTESSLLFFRGGHNHYVAGLDPTFLYLRNPKLLPYWFKLGNGDIRTGIAQLMNQEFKSEWALVDRRYGGMDEAFARAPGIVLAYSDDEVKVYRTLTPASAR